MSLVGRLRAYFLAGCLVTAPIAVTVWLTWLLLDAVDGWIGALIPSGFPPDFGLPVSVPGVGLLVSFVLVTLIGMLTAGWIGGWVVRIGDAILTRTPFLRAVYGTAKQVVEAVLSNRKGLRHVVAIEYPRPGSWTLAFQTGEPTAEVKSIVGTDLVTVFVPTTPNPTAGYLLFIDPKDVVRLDIGPEDALKLIVSGGLWKPA